MPHLAFGFADIQSVYNFGHLSFFIISKILKKKFKIGGICINLVFLRNKKKVVGHYTTPIKETEILLISCEIDRSLWLNLMVNSHLNWLLETRQPARTFDRLFSINAINSSSETPSLGAVVETGLKDTWYVVVLYWWLGIELNVATSVVTARFTASRSGDAILRSEAFGGLQPAGMKEKWEFDVGGGKKEVLVQFCWKYYCPLFPYAKGFQIARRSPKSWMSRGLGMTNSE